MCALLITCNVENITLYKNKLLYTWKFLEGYLKLLKVVHSREWREGGRDCWKEERIGDFTFSFYITHNNKTKLKSLLWQKLCLVFFTRDVIILWKYRWYNIKSDGQRQIPYDLTHHIKNKQTINKPNKTKTSPYIQRTE